MNHDELFKEVLHQFLPEFFTLFFPAEAAQVDFAAGVRFIEQEAFTDFPDGNVRRADVVAEVRTRTGVTELILVYIEVQAARESDVPFRMWEYYHLLRLRHRAPVFPVVLYLAPGAGGLVVERYNESILGRRFLTFEYAVVGLPDLDAEEYEARGEPLSAALAALMRSRGADRIARKFRQMVGATSDETIDEARRFLLATIVDSYLPLSRAEEAELRARLAQGGPQAVSVYDMIKQDFVRQGIERGIEQGIEQGVAQGIEQGVAQGVAQGIVQGQRTALLRLLRARFGELPGAVIARVEAIGTSADLDTLLERVLTANSLADMGLDG